MSVETTPSRTGKQQFQFISWNVRGLNGPVKRANIFQHLKFLGADIVFLQETHLKIKDHSRFWQPWLGQVFHSVFDSRLPIVTVPFCPCYQTTCNAVEIFCSSARY